MFGWLTGNPQKKLQGEYARLMNEAMLLQRSGNMAAFAAKTAEAEEVIQKLHQLNDPQN